MHLKIQKFDVPLAFEAASSEQLRRGDRYHPCIAEF